MQPHMKNLAIIKAVQKSLAHKRAVGNSPAIANAIAGGIRLRHFGDEVAALKLIRSALGELGLNHNEADEIARPGNSEILGKALVGFSSTELLGEFKTGGSM